MCFPIYAIAVILGLPLLAAAHDAGREMEGFARSLHIASKRLVYVSSMRQLHAAGPLSFVTATEVNNTECMMRPEGCTINGHILLKDVAPEPESEAAKFLCRVAGSYYLCQSHTSAADCKADTANGCEVTQVPYSATNKTIVETCDMSDSKLGEFLSKWGLCPSSLAQKFFTCSGALDSTTGASCGTRNGIECKMTGGSCLPANFGPYNFTAGAQQLLNDMQSGNETFWGCCPGRGLLVETFKCSLKTTKATCTGYCEWTGPHSGSTVEDSSEDSSCSFNPAALNTIVGDTSSSFAAYFAKAVAKCSLSNAQACNTDQTPLQGVSKAKAEQYAQLDITAGGGSCGSGTTQTKPLNETTRGTNRSLSASVPCPGAAGGLFSWLATVGALLLCVWLV